MQTAREGGHFLKMLSCIASPIFEIRHFPIVKVTFFVRKHQISRGAYKARREGESQDEPERTASEPKGQKESRARENRIHLSSRVSPAPQITETPEQHLRP